MTALRPVMQIQRLNFRRHTEYSPRWSALEVGLWLILRLYGVKVGVQSRFSNFVEAGPSRIPISCSGGVILAPDLNTCLLSSRDKSYTQLLFWRRYPCSRPEHLPPLMGRLFLFATSPPGDSPEAQGVLPKAPERFAARRLFGGMK